MIEQEREVWDREPDTIWEPVRFEVGQRVRIRLSAECEHRSQVIHAITRERLTAERYGHQPFFDGVTGRVLSIGDPALSTPSDGHVYAVLFDVSIPAMAGLWVGATFCAAEMIPLDAPSPSMAERGEGAG